MVRIICVCGGVECSAQGNPITTAICYCDDCQQAAREIEALPGAASILDANGGTTLTLFRADRFACVRGTEFLVPRKLKERSITNRYLATCCNSLMHLGFDRGPHWVSIWTERLAAPQPSAVRRVMTRYSPNEAALPNDLPKSRRFSPAFLLKVMASRVPMVLKR